MTPAMDPSVTERPSRGSGWRQRLAPTRGRVLLGLALGLVAYGLYWWYDGGRRMFFPRNWAAVEEGLLYRSGQLHEYLVEDRLADHGIRVVVELDSGGPRDEHERAQDAAMEKLGIRYVHCAPVHGDGLGDPACYVTALQEMAQAWHSKTPLLIHCRGGSQRTGAAVAWFRVLFQDWTPARAREEYLSFRGKDDGGRLLRWMDEHVDSVVAGLVRAGDLDASPERSVLMTPRR